MMNNKFLTILTSVATAMLIFTACDKDNTLPDRDDPAVGKARVRLYNASPNSKPVAISVNGTRINAATGNAYYTAFPGEYFLVNPGQSTLRVFDTVSNNPVQYFEISQNLEANKYYSLFAIDSFAKIKPLFLEDKITQPDTARAHIRFLNLMPNSTGMDVMITKYETTTYATPDTLFKNLPFQGLNDFRPLRFGSYDLKVNYRFGASSSGTVTVTALVLVTGGQYTVVLRGFGGATGTPAPTVTSSSFRPTY